VASPDEIRKTRRPRNRPATTAGAREQQLIALAYDAAEEQIRSGKASAQVITHFLKLGTQREKLEEERLKQENILLVAKTSALESASRIEEMYERAIQAMRRYSGQTDTDEPDQVLHRAQPDPRPLRAL
jgi:putative cell wall-binding protein